MLSFMSQQFLYILYNQFFSTTKWNRLSGQTIKKDQAFSLHWTGPDGYKSIHELILERHHLEVDINGFVEFAETCQLSSIMESEARGYIEGIL